ncbi:MAG: hypothetical protein K5985_04360 [Lachnospiraceae bacterium]|nr:hypothetical protein [Lachnospiraceae bacterium]
MRNVALSILAVPVNLLICFSFGALFLRLLRQKLSFCLAAVLGFFVMLIAFDFCCLPVMLKWRPLSLLTVIWAVLSAAAVLATVFIYGNTWKSFFSELSEELRAHPLPYIVMAVLVLLQIVIVALSYEFTLDAAYFVANVTTSLTTNTLNIYDPYTGDWLDHFEFRYFFSTYPLHCAVMCSLFALNALSYMKIAMSAFTLLLSNMMYYLIGRKLFGEEQWKCAAMLVFAGLMNFFFSSIYTPSEFLLTRGYEGKALLGNVVLPMIMYLGILFYENTGLLARSAMLFAVCAGSTVLSNSANMLLPAAIAVFFLPVIIKNKSWKTFLGCAVSVLPNLALVAAYVAYVHGKFVLYTYPR